MQGSHEKMIGGIIFSSSEKKYVYGDFQVKRGK